MRMVAMKNATDNAKTWIDDYTLELNTARQAGHHQELAEITGGAEGFEWLMQKNNPYLLTTQAWTVDYSNREQLGKLTYIGIGRSNCRTRTRP